MTAGEVKASALSVAITVTAVERVASARIAAHASVELDIDGMVIVVHGIQLWHRAADGGIRVELPRFRDRDGTWRPALSLPMDLSKPIALAVVEACADEGIVTDR